jgi:hypothetical protein
MALARPPSFWPGGGVICVNNDRLRPGRPFQIRLNRISASQTRPSAAAATESARRIASVRLRAR